MGFFKKNTARNIMDFMRIIIVYAMKHFLDIDETSLTSERSFKF